MSCLKSPTQHLEQLLIHSPDTYSRLLRSMRRSVPVKLGVRAPPPTKRLSRTLMDEHSLQRRWVPGTPEAASSRRLDFPFVSVSIQFFACLWREEQSLCFPRISCSPRHDLFSEFFDLLDEPDDQAAPKEVVPAGPIHRNLAQESSI